MLETWQKRLNINPMNYFQRYQTFKFHYQNMIKMKLMKVKMLLKVLLTGKQFTMQCLVRINLKIITFGEIVIIIMHMITVWICYIIGMMDFQCSSEKITLYNRATNAVPKLKQNDWKQIKLFKLEKIKVFSLLRWVHIIGETMFKLIK